MLQRLNKMFYAEEPTNTSGGGGGGNNPFATYDFTKFGNDGATVKGLMGDPNGVHKLLMGKRTANQEAQDYRVKLETVAQSGDLTVDQLMANVELLGKLERGQVTYGQLDKDEREIAMELALDGVLEPEKIGIPETDWDRTIEEMREEEPEFDPAKLSPEQREEYDQIQEKLARLDELENYKSVNEKKWNLLKNGANVEKIDDMALLYKPETPDEFKDKDGKVLEGEALTAAQKKHADEYAQKFAAEHAWGYGGGAAVVTTDNGRLGNMTTQEAAYKDAQDKGDVEEMMLNRPDLN